MPTVRRSASSRLTLRFAPGCASPRRRRQSGTDRSVGVRGEGDDIGVVGLAEGELLSLGVFAHGSNTGVLAQDSKLGLRARWDTRTTPTARPPISMDMWEFPAPS